MKTLVSTLFAFTTLSCPGPKTGDTSSPPGDTSDSGTDTVPETSSDTTESPPDSGVDSGEDSSDDSALDTAGDTSNDTGADSGTPVPGCVPVTFDVQEADIVWDHGISIDGWGLSDGLDLTGDGVRDLVDETGVGAFVVWDAFGGFSGGNFFLDDVPGTYLAAGGDLDGDGIGDLVSGPSVRYGPVSAEDHAWNIEFSWDFADPGDLWAPTVFVGDVGGDGVDDIIVHHDEDGEAFVLAGPITAGLSVEEEHFTRLVLPGADALWQGRVDLDGDGQVDVANGTDGETTAVFLGPLSGDLGVEDADRIWSGGRLGGLLDDWDGDGYGEVVTWEDYADYGASVSVIPGSASSGIAKDESTFRILEIVDQSVQYEQGKDIDRDGQPELLLGVPTSGREACARVYLIPQGEGAVEIEEAASMVYGVPEDEGGTRLGQMVIGSLDFDDDGRTDIITSNPDYGYWFGSVGIIYFISAGGLL